MFNFKRLFGVVPYILSAAVLFSALYFDKQAFLTRQEDLENRSGYPPAVGAIAPDFKLTSLTDKAEVSSQSLCQDGNVLFIFSSVSCPFTEQFIGELTQLITSQNKSIENVCLVFDVGTKAIDNAEAARIADRYPNIRIFADKNSSAAWGFKLRAYPTQYIVEPDSTILYRQIGYSGKENTKILFERFFN
ncbi:MAG: redoxin domain-containing protein [Oscillospiraceae bacterium]